MLVLAQLERLLALQRADEDAARRGAAEAAATRARAAADADARAAAEAVVAVLGDRRDAEHGAYERRIAALEVQVDEWRRVARSRERREGYRETERDAARLKVLEADARRDAVAAARDAALADGRALRRRLQARAVAAAAARRRAAADVRRAAAAAARDRRVAAALAPLEATVAGLKDELARLHLDLSFLRKKGHFLCAACGDRARATVRADAATNTDGVRARLTQRSPPAPRPPRATVAGAAAAAALARAAPPADRADDGPRTPRDATPRATAPSDKVVVAHPHRLVGHVDDAEDLRAPLAAATPPRGSAAGAAAAPRARGAAKPRPAPPKAPTPPRRAGPPPPRAAPPARGAPADAKPKRRANA